MRKLNIQQSNAAKSDSGINLVIAGAGTGKTSTMIAKIKNVIQSSLIKPEEIAILTFSKKAADEIKERLESDIGAGLMTGFTGTFHSFALFLLKENSAYYISRRKIDSFPTVITSDEKKIIMRRLIMSDPGKFLGLPADAVLYLSENLNYLDKKIIMKLKSGPLYNEICSINNIYENYKNKNMLIEFEDMINHAADLIEYYPQLRNNIIRKYRYIFVDEFQDTSENNFRLLSLLLPVENKNLFMVGDDFQSIYKFRHSRVEFIINAEKYFPEVSVHKLTVNYRSKKEIIALSNRFIKLNRFRTSKKISSERGNGGIIRFYNVDDMHDESERLYRIVSSISGDSSIAVLYRNNYQGDFFHNRFYSVKSDKTIQFMTMHASKGLEFDVVIITGISDRIIPDRTSDLEEERRLFYVALTRAKNELHLLYYKNDQENLPRFIRELGYRK